MSIYQWIKVSPFKAGWLGIEVVNKYHLFSALRHVPLRVAAFVVSLSCPVLCDPMDCSTPGFPVLHHLPELTQLMSIESVMPSSYFILCRPLLFSVFLKIRVFPMSQLFSSGGQSIGVSASASVLPMNTKDWSPLGWTGWISLLSKGLSRVFSNNTAQKHPFFGIQLSL